MAQEPVQWLDQAELAAWRGWVSLAAHVRAGIGRDLARDHGLSEPEYAVLVHLSESPNQRIRMTDLAVGLEWSKSRLSHLVGRMEARGLLTRQECPEDGRGQFAVLTATGMEEITRAAPDHVASVRRHFLDHLDREQILQLASLTAMALERLQASDSACPSLADGGCPGDDLTAGTLDCQGEELTAS